MKNNNLLLELLVEELPPKALKKLGEAFSQGIAQGLQSQGLLGDLEGSSVTTFFASPRRLAVHITHVKSKAENQAVSQKLMPSSVGFDANGQPTPALLKKLAALGHGGHGLDVVNTLRRVQDGKAEVLYIDATKPGVELQAGLQCALEAAIAQLPIPKMMSYQLADGWTSVNFVRPAHGLVALHGDAVVPVQALGLRAGRQTQGHRFEAKTTSIEVASADSYAEQLHQEGAVIACFAQRRADIVRQLNAVSSNLHLTPVQDDALLDEVTALVERPNVLACTFDAAFLGVPPQCLILTMKANQKYFPLLDAAGTLTHHFLVVSNITPDDPSAVVQGNERVVRPRLADAKFFFDQDRKKTLAARVPGLQKVVYHNKLGTQGERILRVQKIVAGLVGLLPEGLQNAALAVDCDRVAQLAKADLLTDMVGEFPELQGVMGAYYARHEGLNEQVAQAIEDHYKPRFAGDALPQHLTGQIVALADKLETLAGLFGIGQVPSGDKDPFALRRHALGVIRLLIEEKLPLSLPQMLTISRQAFGDLIEGRIDDSKDALKDFIFERLAGLLREPAYGYSAQEIDAVLALRPSFLLEIPQRLAAVRSFMALPEAASLASANKRIGNILKKVAALPKNSGECPAMAPISVDTHLLQEVAEQTLHHALKAVVPVADAAFAQGNYTASLQSLAALKVPVDAFFEGVMVNAEDAALRANRLALLSLSQQAMNRIADLSRLNV